MEPTAPDPVGSRAFGNPAQASKSLGDCCHAAWPQRAELSSDCSRKIPAHSCLRVVAECPLARPLGNLSLIKVSVLRMCWCGRLSKVGIRAFTVAVTEAWRTLAWA